MPDTQKFPRYLKLHTCSKHPKKQVSEEEKQTSKKREKKRHRGKKMKMHIFICECKRTGATLEGGISSYSI